MAPPAKNRNKQIRKEKTRKQCKIYATAVCFDLQKMLQIFIWLLSYIIVCCMCNGGYIYSMDISEKCLSRLLVGQEVVQS